MTERPRPVHVTFGPSARGSLYQALRPIGNHDEVLCLYDDLSFGPIDRPNVKRRMQWSGDVLDLEGNFEVEELIEAFWRRVTVMRTEIVVWMSSKSVSEYCGFLELLRRGHRAPISVVDVADVSTSFASLHHNRIAALGLIDRAVRISDAERQRYLIEWQRVRDENGALRILTPSGLASAPITYFDDILLSFVTDEWQTFARITWKALAKNADGPYRQCSSDELLFDRLIRLVESDVIDGESDEDVWTMYESRVRRHPARDE